MNKLKAIAQAMAIFDKNDLLNAGSLEYEIVTEVIFSKIERLGPEKALKLTLD
jgi:hypothetical protein